MADRLRGRMRELYDVTTRRLLHRTAAGVATTFHKVYYDASERGGSWKDTRWFGVETSKCPLDMWVFQEIFVEVRPDLIVEVGTYFGGSALYYAHLCDLIGNGEVISIDITVRPGRAEHDRITFLEGPSLDPSIIETVRARAAAAGTVMVFLDGDHAADTVLTELRTYGPMVTPGSYLVAEDTNVNGRPVRPDHGPGPGDAVDAFLEETDDFEVDRDREKFLLTFNPGGYLRKRTRKGSVTATN